MLPRLRLRGRLLLSIFILFFIVYILRPYDNPVILLIRWHASNIRYYYKSSFYPPGHPHHAASPLYNISSNDIGHIIKTGYATKDRLEAKLKAMDERWKSGNVVIAGDYGSYAERKLNGAMMEVHDVVAGLEKEGFGEGKGGGRMELLRRFRKATEDPEGIAGSEEILKDGWELDIMKHIPALELGFKHLLPKKWYLMTDDDTYIHLPSLTAILSTLDSTRPHYLGNAIGSYTLRFAHGGSGIIFSHSALSHIFSPHHMRLITSFKLKSLTADFGDKIIAELAMETGIYLNEEYSMHFNGESPWKSMIRKERFCSEVVGFHGMRDGEMDDTAVVLSGVEDKIRWWDLWWDFGKGNESIEDLGTGLRIGEGRRVRQGWDFVSRVDEHSNVFKIKTEIDCEKACDGYKECLSWKWERGKCWVVPWVRVGEKVGDAIVSGVNAKRLAILEKACGS
ncbi:uncharacterized protein PAC_06815 [Phialocephala subalpina]|uniref:N-acetylgalactosaminide beta-1,3-galactosyltransferase n=1 Tax=Phialocephala subalpina TaxID=576137 RepID=A0A1L7WVX3_9HELO|nr:uncharacterized protein PAC_06815 [Phialocephala subalpina]